MHRLRHHRCCCHRCRRCGPDCLRCGICSHLPWRWHSAGRPQSHGRTLPCSCDCMAWRALPVPPQRLAPLRATSASASTLGSTIACPAADAARTVLGTSIACTGCGTTAAAATAAGVAAPIASAVGSAATCPGGGIVRGALTATGVVALQLRLRPQSRWGPDRLHRGIRSHLPWRWHSAGRPQSHGRSRLAAAIAAPIALRPRSPPPWDLQPPALAAA